ncbi:MAG TPA: serine hydrolase [bacterium]
MLRRLSPATAVALAAGLVVLGVALGYALRSLQVRPDNAYEIRGGRSGLTNPLLDCEVHGYRHGRELPSFQHELEGRVADLLRGGTVREVSVYFRDLDNGPWVGVGEDRPFAPGSLLKLPTIIACLKQAEADPAFLDRTVRFQGALEGGVIAGFDPGAPLEAGKEYTVRELLARTGALSDNYSLMLLNRLVDRRVLRQIYHDLGLAAPADVISQAVPISPKTYGQIFRVLYNASYLSRQMSETALGLLTDTVFAGGLVAGVPPGTTVSHKFGIYTEPAGGATATQLHDCGIVYHSRRPYFLCVMTRGTAEPALEAAIRDVASFVYARVDASTAGGADGLGPPPAEVRR